MDFATVILVLVAYLLRLHQLIPGGEWLFAQKYLMVASLAAMVFRSRGFEPKDLVRTPLDWAMVLYLGFIVWHEEEHWETFKEVWKLFAFYAVTVQALCNSRRLYIYMATWAGCLVVLALVTLDSAYGIDFSNSKGLLSLYQDRQCLNLSIYNNPNALGHTMILGLPMVYYAFFYKGTSTMRIGAILMWAAIGYAVILTESKGAFVVGAAVTGAALWIGKSWPFRIVLIVLALGMGVGAFRALPRMEAMQSSDALASDEGVWGRLIVWDRARTDLMADNDGCGWKEFFPLLSHVDALGRMTFFQKGPHSSYIAVAAELGYVGLFLYLLVLLVAARIVVQFGTTSHDMDRARYLILIVLLGYGISGWLIERPYHVEYFFLGAIACSLYRIRVDGEIGLKDEAMPSPEKKRAPKESPEDQREAPGRVAIPVVVLTNLGSAKKQPLIAGAEISPQTEEETKPDPLETEMEVESKSARAEAKDFLKPLRWKRLGIVDALLAFCGVRAVIEVWDWALNQFFY
jgi:O-antigen ligase